MEIPQEIPEVFRDRYVDVIMAIGRASMRLNEAHAAYAETVKERIALNEEIHHWKLENGT